MPLIEPIIDRTQTDVTNKTQKGFINYVDLNRIESNCIYLSEQLNLYGYYVNIVVKTNWTMTDFPYQSQIDRIRNNINALITAFHKMQGSPDIKLWDSLDFNDANSLEQNLENIDTLIQRMIVGFRCSGTFYGGQEVIFP